MKTETKLNGLRLALASGECRAIDNALARCEDLLNMMEDVKEADAFELAFTTLAKTRPIVKTESVGQGIARIMREQKVCYARAKSLYFCPEGRHGMR